MTCAHAYRHKGYKCTIKSEPLNPLNPLNLAKNVAVTFHVVYTAIRLIVDCVAHWHCAIAHTVVHTVADTVADALGYAVVICFYRDC